MHLISVLCDIRLNLNLQTRYNLYKITPEMKTRKMSQMLTTIIVSVPISETFTFKAQRLSKLKDFQAQRLSKLKDFQSSKTDTFSVVLSLQTYLLALADWL